MRYVLTLTVLLVATPAVAEVVRWSDGESVVLTDGDQFRWVRQVPGEVIYDHPGETGWGESRQSNTPRFTITVWPVEALTPQTAFMPGVGDVRAVPTVQEPFTDDGMWSQWLVEDGRLKGNGQRGWMETGASLTYFGEAVFYQMDRIGDVNQDGTIDGLDVDPFVNAVLFEPDNLLADLNGDLVVTGLDVAPFVAALVGDGVAAVPEPSSLAMLLVAMVAAGLFLARCKMRYVLTMTVLL